MANDQSDDFLNAENSRAAVAFTIQTLQKLGGLHQNDKRDSMLFGAN